MKTGRVPHLDKDVSRIVAGADWLLDSVPRAGFRALDAYFEAGGRVFDTAYCYGANTLMLGIWMKERGIGDEVIHFDKVAHPMWKDGQKVSRVTREAIREELDRNHDWLGKSYTDFCVLHRDDPEVPVGEIVDWLDELKNEGRIGVYGGSNWKHERIAAANEYAVKAGKQPFSLNNPNMTLAENTEPLWDDCLTIGAEGRAWHQESGLPLFSWSTTARGYFAGVEDGDVQRAYDNPTSRARLARAREFGEQRGLSTVAVALAWALNQPFPVFALSGMRTAEQVEENLKVLDVELSPEELRWLEFGDE